MESLEHITARAWFPAFYIRLCTFTALGAGMLVLAPFTFDLVIPLVFRSIIGLEDRRWNENKLLPVSS